MNNNPKTDAFRRLYERRLLPDDALEVLDRYRDNGNLETYIDQFAEAFSERLRREDQQYVDLHKKTAEFEDEIMSLQNIEQWDKEPPGPLRGQGTLEQEQKILDSLKKNTPDVIKERAKKYFLRDTEKDRVPKTAFSIMKKKFAEQKEFEKRPNANVNAVIPAVKKTSQQLGRQVGLTARYLAEAIVGGVIDPFYQLSAFTTNLAMPENFQAPASLVPEISSMLDKAGLPNPKGTAEKIVASAAKMVAASGAGIGTARGVASMMGPVKGAVNVPEAALQGKMTATGPLSPTTPGVQAAKSMATEPALQARAAAGAGIAQGIAEQAGVGPIGQAAANLAGGGITGLVTGKKRDISALKEAQKRNINVPTSDIIKLPFQKAYDFITDLTLLGPRAIHRAPQSKRKVEAIARTFDEFGGTDIINASEKVAYDLITKKYKRLENYTDIQNRIVLDMMETGMDVPMNNTIDAFTSAIDRLEKANKDSFAPAITIFKKFRDRFKEIDFEDTIVNKRLIGEMLDDPNLASISTEPKKMAREIYRAIKTDTENFILNNGGPDDVRRWKRANERISTMIEDLKNKSLRDIFEAGKYTRIDRKNGRFDIELKIDEEDLQSATESVINMLNGNKKSQNIALYKNLSQQGKANARAAILQDAVQKSGGLENIDPKKFRKNIADKSNTIGIHFKEKDYDSITGLITALKLTSKSDPGIGIRYSRNLPYYVTAGMAPIAGGIYNAIVGSLSLGQLANIFESRYIRNMLIKIPKMKVGPEKEAAAKNVLRAIQSEILNIKSAEENELKEEKTNYIKRRKIATQ